MEKTPLIQFRENKPFVFSIVFSFLYFLFSIIVVEDIYAQMAIKCVLGIGAIIYTGIFASCGINSRNIIHGILIGSPFLVNGMVAFIVSVFKTDFLPLRINTIDEIMIFTLTTFLLAASEEISFRGLILNALFEKYGDTYKGTWKSIILSSFLFALVHFANFVYVQPSAVLAQVISAFFAGLYFGAIFFNSRNLFSCIIIHYILDWLALFVGYCFTSVHSNASAVCVITLDLDMVSYLICGGLAAIIPLVLSFIIMQKKYFTPWSEEIQNII